MSRKLLLFFLLLGGYWVAFAQDSSQFRILFVGNSYTYFWNLPQSVQSMATDQGLEVEVRQSTAGGANLGEHWRGEKGLETRRKIESGGFDLVVLQDFSTQSLVFPDSLRIYVGKLIDLIKAKGGKPALYMTWSRQWDPFMIEEISAVYKEVAQEHGAILVPVGKAWRMAKELRPELSLYDPDGSHPSPTGTYLTACVMYATLFDRSPIGLPKRLTTIDRNGELLYLNIQAEEDAVFLQKVARAVIEEMASNSPTSNN